MPKHSNVLIAILAISFLGFVIFGAVNFHTTLGVIAAVTAFGLAMVFLAYVALARNRNRKPATSRYSALRMVKVVVASYAAAWALAMLLAIVALPWFGSASFDIFFRWWVLIAFGVTCFPFVQRHLS